MRYSTWTFLSLLSVINKALSTSQLTAADHTSYNSDLADEVEQFKQNLRSRTSVYKTIPNLNKSIEEKRRELQNARAKFDEMFDAVDYEAESIHKRDLYSYQSTGRFITYCLSVQEN